ncbi:MAG: isochorismatase family protein [Planctomycetota bacterium]|nr:MAG: isochorismatase family protein [Planctomycetota bacterium]
MRQFRVFSSTIRTWWLLVALGLLPVLHPFTAFGESPAAGHPPTTATDAGPLRLRLRYQVETAPGSGRFHRFSRSETWDPRQTAIIVCDMWDSHTSVNAVRRVNELAPRLNRVLHAARRRGVTIIHAPSGCMDAYAAHPARLRARRVPDSKPFPKDIGSWCHRIPAEDKLPYPIDQSDGGRDDDPEEHALWVERLKALGRNPNRPWLRESPLIDIDAEVDFISDDGREIWNILKHRGIRNVILTGVHTNMCVLGRPFGLRQMVRNGFHTVLMRDMTDTMYNPQRRPFVSHFTGTDLIIDYIERCVCPTITSDQFVGGRPFRFSADLRPHLVCVIAEDEYETERTLPEFALRHLGWDFRVSFVFGSEKERNRIPGLEAVRDADVLMLSVRRRALPEGDLAIIRRHVALGKPVCGIRTASHAFALRGKSELPAGHAVWPEFDAEVLGGNYQGHYSNAVSSVVQVLPEAAQHPILAGITETTWPQGGSLYKNAPLRPGARALLIGRGENGQREPVAWVFLRANGGRSFYTSLGHKDDFRNPAFTTLLYNALLWLADRPSRTADGSPDRVAGRQEAGKSTVGQAE